MKASEKLRQLQEKSHRIVEDLANKGDFDFLLKEIPEQIRKRTQLGKGVDESGKNIKLNPLSESYIAYREGKLIFRTSKFGFAFPILNEESTFIQAGKETKGRGKSRVGAVTKISFKKKNSIIKPVLDSNTRPKKSNLTATGQMLRAIFGTRQGTRFIFSFKGSREDGKTNDEVASYAPKLGRPFFNLSNTERVGVQRKLAQLIRNALKKIGA